MQNHMTPPALPQPALPYSNQSEPLLAIIRIIGFLGVAVGAIDVALGPLVMLYYVSERSGRGYPGDSFYVVNLLVGCFVSFALGLCVLIGGIGCLRTKPHGRFLLIWWAVATVVWAIYGVAINTWYVFAYSRGYTKMAMAYTAGYQLQQWILRLVLPTFMLLLFRQRHFREPFASSS